MEIFRKMKKTHPNINAIIVGLAIVIFWRGAWGLLDLYFFPGNETLSYIISIFLGLFLLFIDDFKLKEIE